MRLRRLFKKEEISWAALVLEIFSVTLSVLVALAIGDWHEERQKRKGVEQALRGIEAELASNQRQIARRASYYHSVLQGLEQRLATEGPDVPLFPLEEWHGLDPARLTSASYQVALETQAFANMDIETATSVARIYSYQEFYSRLTDKFLDAMIAGRLQETSTFRGALSEVHQFTQGMAGGYETVRGKIRKKLGEPMPVPSSQAKP